MARRTADAPKFRRKQKVVAVRDLAGVPEGTEGVVYYEAGLRCFHSAAVTRSLPSTLASSSPLAKATW